MQQQAVQVAQAPEYVLREQPQSVAMKEEVAQVGQVSEQVILQERERGEERMDRWRGLADTIWVSG